MSSFPMSSTDIGPGDIANAMDSGHNFGADGESFVRIDLVCPPQLVDKAFTRLALARGCGASDNTRPMESAL